MNRPTGMTVVCLLLGWLTLGATGNAALLLSGLFASLPFPRWLGLFWIAYGVTAGVSTHRLWRMETSGHQWLRAWMAVCVVTGLAMMPVFVDLAFGGIAATAALLALSLLPLWPLDRYVAAVLRRGS